MYDFPDCNDNVLFLTFIADEPVWLQSLALPEETQDVDRLFYNYLRNKWMKLEETGGNL